MTTHDVFIMHGRGNKESLARGYISSCFFESKGGLNHRDTCHHFL